MMFSAVDIDMQEMRRNRIFLVGFMGSGKTSYGKLLSDRLHIPFLDQDELLQCKYGMTIPELFEQRGEESFREVERDLLREYAYPPAFIFASGGGCPCFYDNLDWMKRHGKTIYLNATPELLARRLSLKTESRPLIKGKSPRELLQFIKESLSRRSSFYERAETILSIDAECDEEQILTALIEIATFNS